jgi:IS605 OrfB family transposase
VRDYDVIAIEDLNVKGMSRGFLSRSMLDAAFGEFTRQLAYKAAWYGKQLVNIDRYFPSSKRCSACGHQLQELKLSVRSWRCPTCDALIALRSSTVKDASLAHKSAESGDTKILLLHPPRSVCCRIDPHGTKLVKLKVLPVKPRPQTGCRAAL